MVGGKITGTTISDKKKVKNSSFDYASGIGKNFFSAQNRFCKGALFNKDEHRDELRLV